jgi:hypothetical protein
MKDLNILSMKHLEGKNVVFFSLGDAEVQRELWGSTSGEVVQHNLEETIRISTLFWETNVFSASNVFESEATRRLFRDHSRLFCSGKSLFAIRSEVSDYLEHVETKRKVCPSDPAYRKQSSLGYAKDLQEIGIALHREGDISALIAKHWMDDLNENEKSALTDGNSLGTLLTKNFGEQSRNRYRRMLADVAKKRKDFEIVRPYVEKQLKNFPAQLLPNVNSRLLSLYLVAVSETMSVNLMDMNGGKLYHGSSNMTKQNVPLATYFVKMLGIYDPIMRMKDSQLLELSNYPEFTRVRKMYLQLINEAKTIQENKMKLYWEYIKEKARLTYSQYSDIFKKAAQFCLVVSLSRNLPPVENAAASLLAPEIVDFTIRKIIHVERTPLNDLRRVVLEGYDKSLDTVVTDLDSRGNWNKPSVLRNVFVLDAFRGVRA